MIFVPYVLSLTRHMQKDDLVRVTGILHSALYKAAYVKGLFGQHTQGPTG